MWPIRSHQKKIHTNCTHIEVWVFIKFLAFVSGKAKSHKARSHIKSMQNNQAFYLLPHSPLETIHNFYIILTLAIRLSMKGFMPGFHVITFKNEQGAAICVIKKKQFKASAGQFADIDDRETASGSLDRVRRGRGTISPAQSLPLMIYSHSSLTN